MKGKLKVDKDGLMLSEYFERHRTVTGWIFDHIKEVEFADETLAVVERDPLSSVGVKDDA
jgi:hypothetical protein